MGHGALGGAGRRGPHVPGGAECLQLCTPGRDPRRGLHDDRGVLGAGGRTGPVHARGNRRMSPPAGDRPAVGGVRYGTVVERSGRCGLRRSVARAGGEVADHAQGADVPTDGRIVAPTTSLPRRSAGSAIGTTGTAGCATPSDARGADDRWLRGEASEFCPWLLRATAGHRRRTSCTGSPGSACCPSRSSAGLPIRELEPREDRERGLEQFQLDIYGELMDAATSGARSRARWTSASLGSRAAVLGFLESAWKEPDDGIWEVWGRAGTSRTRR